jgi:dGTPase
MGECKYASLIIRVRRKLSNKSGRGITEETSSDRARAIFCSSFRRLQQKAQVFSLETNTSVRTRLSHSLEVANTGKLIAEKIAYKLRERNQLSSKRILAFINIVETSCLLHDIGNPPFGHLGEKAIQKWFSLRWRSVYKKALNIKEISKYNEILEYVCDFTKFDGNPQGFRLITYLQSPTLEYLGYGLNLTYSTIHSLIKYPTFPGVNLDKSGYFFSEKDIVNEISNKLNLKTRHPLSYIMEAADDISNCISDIEDGIEKKLIDIDDFFLNLKSEWKSRYNKILPLDLNKYIVEKKYKKNSIVKSIFKDYDKNKKCEESFFYFKVKFVQALIECSARKFLKNHGKFLKGNENGLFIKSDDEHKLLRILKNEARKKLYRSRDAEDKEMAGYHIIYGLLEKYRLLLELKEEKFNILINFRKNPEGLQSENLDLELRLFNRLPQKYINAYIFSVNKNKKLEWFYRAHLIVDFIAGMTDQYSLELYRLLYGIDIK